ncbi:MAG: HAD family hydrolase [Victivallaceae bacterium]|nr:HAD family hydrolase [Victivallaceae bacterium]
MLVYTPDSYPKTLFRDGARALFLDRDGVINTEITYLYRIEDFEFIDGIFTLCRTAAERNYRIIVVTNQSGIARGYYNENDLAKLTKWMLEEFTGRGIRISAVYACPHLVNADLKTYRRDCPGRKPNPGMLLRAQKDFKLDLAESIFIGDKICDMEAGLRAGIGSLLLFSDTASVPGDLRDKVRIISSLKEAEKFLK